MDKIWNRMLEDALDCIADREEHSPEQLAAMRAYVIAHEQALWDQVIGPAVDELARELESGLAIDELARALEKEVGQS